MSDGRAIIDERPFAWVIATLGKSPRWRGGVWRDRPWVREPWRKWVYTLGRGYGSGGSGLHRITARIGIESCFPVTRQNDRLVESDVETLGAIILAEDEDALFSAAGNIAGIEDAELSIGEVDVATAVHRDDRSGTTLGLTLMPITITYTRGFGNPYTREAQAR